MGEEIVKTGSITASSGTNTAPFNSILIPFSLSVITVNWVASEPVPAVVGIAAIGGILPVIVFPI